MTHDDVMRLTGRELDAAVAAMVFGLGVVECDPVGGRYGPYTVREGHWTRVNGETYPLLDLLPEYSTDIAAAWQVFERNGYLGLVSYMGEEYVCELHAGFDEDGQGVKVQATGLTAPEAICRAALLAAIKEAE